jgi:SnoaL-like domain
MQAGMALLAGHVERFNAGVRSGDFGPMVDGFSEDAELLFEGIPVGPFRAHEAIAAAYRTRPPDDEIELLDAEHDSQVGVQGDRRGQGNHRDAPNLEEVRSGLASRFAGIPDVHYGEDRHWVSGDRGCSEWLLTGTTTQGDRVEARGCDLFEFKGDKIARKDSYRKLVER